MDELRIFSTLPLSKGSLPERYLDTAIEVARWTEEAGFVGSLVYTDNSLLDPWVVGQAVISATERWGPLVAVQPVYMHPYAVATLVSSIGFLYGRRLFLNMVAGGFINDLLALDDRTEHDDRYARLVEYTTIVTRLLEGDGPVTHEGEWYRVRNLRLAPTLDRSLLPGITVSGSSEAGARAANMLGATAIQYPRPARDHVGSHEVPVEDRGIRIGIIARPDPVEAWRVAWSRFPGDERGRMTHQLAMRSSDSVWHRQLSVLADESVRSEDPYWLHPFENYRTFCPYLVGSYEEVGRALSEYLRLGVRTLITDVPSEPDDLHHIGQALERAGHPSLA